MSKNRRVRLGRKIVKDISAVSAHKGSGDSGKREPILVERLERRVLLTTFTVNTVNDSGPGSLRQAILNVNADGAADTDTIAFSIGTGAQTIAPTSALPFITRQVMIDGTTQPGYAGTPLIDLSGASAGASANGLTLQGGSDTVKGLVINGWTFSGIYGFGTGGNTITGCYIGTDATGMSAVPNQIHGIEMDIGQNTITYNVVSGNGAIGIFCLGTSAGGNTIQGNYVGVNAAGNGIIANGDNGIDLQQATNNLIGGTGTGQGNVISGNGADGILLFQDADDNTIQGNLIGTDVTGTLNFGNGAWGIEDQTIGNLIGGTTAAARNVLSGNAQSGVVLYSAGSMYNTVEGNYVGTDITGTKAIPNVLQGVVISNSPTYNTIGGTTAGARNIISGNGVGVGIFNSATNNVVEGNYIGTDVTGNVAMANSTGIQLFGDCSDNTIGGTAAGAGNIIGASQSLGLIDDSNDVTIQGNTFGLGADGTTAMPIATFGILTLSGASGDTIGGAAAGDGNVIANCGSFGIDLSHGSGTLVQNNDIGTEADGVTPAPNAGAGVFVDTSSNDTISNNVIHANTAQGVVVGAGTGNTISQNSIYANGALGIDLAGDGVTANGPGGQTTGPNNSQNYPVLSSVSVVGGMPYVSGYLVGSPSSSFRLEFFASPTADASGFGQGDTYLTSVSVNTDVNGNATFTNVALPAASAMGSLSATATDAGGDTSEFSQDLSLPATTTPTGPTITTTTSVTSNNNPATAGQSVTFKATVSPSGSETGSVQFKIDGVNAGNPVPVSNNTASFSTSTLSATSHSIVAIYSGDSSYITSTSTALTQVVNAAAPISTSSTLSSSTNPAGFGQSVSFSDSVTPASGIASGTAQFKIDNVNFGAPVAVSAGSATSASTTTLSSGTHSVSVSFTDSSGTYAPSNGALTQTVNSSSLAVTTTSLTTNRNPTIAGNSGGNPGSNTQYITLVATVSGGSGTPTGTVQFQINGVNYGSPVALVNGVATSAPTTTLQNGAPNIEAIYSGDSKNGSSSATVSDTPYLGTPFVLPTGNQAPTTIQAEDYDDGGQGVGYNWFEGNVHTTGPFRSNEDVYTETTTDTGGGYDVGYVYVPSWLNYTVVAPANETYQLAFRVSSNGPGGNFHVNVDGVNVTGTITIPSTGDWQAWTTLTSQTFSMSAGTHVIRLMFDSPRNGDVIGNFNWFQVIASSNTALASTSTGVSSSLNPSSAGQSVTFTATVTPNTAGVTPTGTVQWIVDNTPVGSPVALSGNQATLTTSTLASGVNHSVIAEYGGDSTYAGSQGTFSQAVGISTLATPSVSLGSSANPAAVGQSVSFTATVSGSAGTPTGTVQFQIDNVNFGTPVAVGTNGVATSSATTTLASGGHSITAIYSGNASYNSFTATLAQTIGSTANGATPFLGSAFVLPTTIQAEDFDNGGEGVGYHKVRIFASPTNYRTSNVYIENSADVGGGYDVGYIFAKEWLEYSVTTPINATTANYTASFRVSSDGLGGTFHLEVDGVNVTGSLAVPSTGGWQNWITLTSSPFAVTPGAHSFKVVFDTPAPDGGLVCNFNYMQISAASGTALAPTGTQVTSSQNPSTAGQSVTFTATVTPNTAGVTPTGTVQWLIDNTDVGTPVPLTGNQATLTTSALTAGVNHTVVAQYSGDSTYAGSNNSLIQTVSSSTLATPSVSVSSSLTPSTVGQAVTFSATVSGSAGTPTGTVQFQVDNVNFGAAVPVGTNGVAFSSATTTLAGGGHSITALYSGDANYSVGSGSTNQTVNAVATGPATVQIDAGGGAAAPFSADTDFSSSSTSNYGTVAVNTSAITAMGLTPAPQSVYDTERYGTFTYTIPNLTPGATYSVRLDFAELFWTAAGQRIFNVSINGIQVLSNFDIFATAGGADKAIAEVFTATASSSGNIAIAFNTVKDNAKVSAITVTPTAAPVSTPPAITTNPGNQTATTGQTVSFTAAASGTPSPTVQWQMSTDGGNTFSNIGGATSTTYSFTAATGQNGFEYQAVFSNSVGTPATTTAATLTVNAPANQAPAISTNPTNQTVTVGQTATFTAAASGYPTPNVQWQMSTDGGKTFGNVPNATSAVYSFTAATGQNGYEYQAVFTNGVGNPATTTAATLTVNAVATTPTVQIDAGGGAAAPYSADTDFSGGTVYSVNSAINTSIVSAQGLTPAPQSVYDTERYGNFTYTIPNLTPGASYTVRLDFAELFWTAAGKRVFNVAINGSQALNSFDIFAAAGGANKAIAEAFTITATSSGNIVIAFTSLVDNAKVDAITVTSATPPVNTAPSITTNPGNQTVAVGQTVNFTAAASGTPTPNVLWQMSTDGGKTFTPISSATSATYSFTAAMGENGDEFEAVFTNGVGNPATTTAATLTVTAAPPAPAVLIDSGGSAAGSYSADTDFSGGSTSNFGNVAVNTSAISAQGLTPAPQSAYDTERYGNFTYTIPNLTPGASYTVRLDFAELYWTAVGQRVFNVAINGTQVLTNFDIIAAAGAADKAIAEVFTATASSSGNISISFTTVVNNAKVSAITISPSA